MSGHSGESGRPHGRVRGYAGCPGWTIFNPILNGVYHPDQITIFNNGKRPKRYSGIYTSDLMGRLTVDYINRFSSSEAPFFIWTSQVAPHRMRVGGKWRYPVPAPRHRTLYPDALPPAMSSPAFNETDVSDKPVHVRSLGKVSAAHVTKAHRLRIRSLRSVDDQVAATVRALSAKGELSNTYIFFTSDNGYLLGEHRMTGKNVPYEEALQVPLLVRGPGLPLGVTRNAMYSLVDLAPTFLQLAGASPGRTQDGRSMLATLRDGEPGYDQYLLQAARGTREPWWWRGVRSHRYTYVRYTGGFEELYDRAVDPAELENVARDPSYVDERTHHATQLSQLQRCSGASCR